MRAMVALTAGLLIAMGGAAAAKPRVSVPSCKTSLAEFAKGIGDDAKHVSVSPALTSAEYAFAKDLLKKHSADHKPLPGDGAVFIAADKQFIIALTKGAGDTATVCAVTGVPVEMVVAVMESDTPTAAKPESKKADPDELRL